MPVLPPFSVAAVPCMRRARPMGQPSDPIALFILILFILIPLELQYSSIEPALWRLRCMMYHKHIMPLWSCSRSAKSPPRCRPKEMRMVGEQEATVGVPAIPDERSAMQISLTHRFFLVELVRLRKVVAHLRHNLALDAHLPSLLLDELPRRCLV